MVSSHCTLCPLTLLPILVQWSFPIPQGVALCLHPRWYFPVPLGVLVAVSLTLCACPTLGPSRLVPQFVSYHLSTRQVQHDGRFCLLLTVPVQQSAAPHACCGLNWLDDGLGWVGGEYWLDSGLPGCVVGLCGLTVWGGRSVGQ